MFLFYKFARLRRASQIEVLTRMNFKEWIFCGFFAVTLFGSGVFPGVAEAKTEQPGALIEEVSHEVLEIVRQARDLEQSHEEDSEKDSEKVAEKYIRENLQTYLDSYVDFATFARGVMGKYRDEVSQDKTQDFVADFKNTLVNLYGKAMLAFEVKDVSIANTAKPRPNMAQVTMHVTSQEGASFTVKYSLRKNKEDAWKVLNVVMDGVNLGLTYRNQFYSAVDANDGDVTAAIDNWSKVMKNVQDETSAKISEGKKASQNGED